MFDPNVLQFTDLLVRSDRTPLDRTFFNTRFKAITDAVSKVATEVSKFSEIEATFVGLALDRLNDTLGPMLLKLDQASELGFLVAQADGVSISLSTDTPSAADFVITDGGELFTPTPYLLALDNLDSTNWGIVEVIQWTPLTGDLATRVIFRTKVQASTQWTLSANSAVLPAMIDILEQTEGVLAEANTAKDEAETAIADIAAAMVTVNALLEAISDGPVVSVAGRGGEVVLAMTDIVGLIDALAAKASSTSLTSGLNSKQASSAKLDTLVALAWAAGVIPYFTSTSEIGSIASSAFGRALLNLASAAALATAAGLGNVDNTSDANKPVSTAQATAIGLKLTTAGSAAALNGTINPDVLTGTSVTITGTTLTLGLTHLGRRLRFTAATAVTVTLPNDLPAEFNCMWEQRGAGQMTFTPASGATRRNRSSHTKSAGQYAQGALYIDSNAGGNTADYTLSGDTAA